MKMRKALKEFRETLEAGHMHIYATNACYDRCRHCYMGALPENSPRADHINLDDLIHFVELMNQGRNTPAHIGLSGGDPLAHKDCVELITLLSENSRLEILTSGLALSKKNQKRDELLEALIESKASFLVASPDEPYHSISWDDVENIRDYVKKQGHNPNKLGYSSKAKKNTQKLLMALNPLGLALMGVAYLTEKCSPGPKEPLALPFGRGKNLPVIQQKPAPEKCSPAPTNIYLGPDGSLQYCMYTCKDGFMNISELRGISKKEEAISLILNRFAEDVSARDMVARERCYFTKSVRKKSGALNTSSS